MQEVARRHVERSRGAEAENQVSPSAGRSNLVYCMHAHTRARQGRLSPCCPASRSRGINAQWRACVHAKLCAKLRGRSLLRCEGGGARLDITSKGNGVLRGQGGARDRPPMPIIEA